MSFSFRQGKDEVHFITEEDLNAYVDESRKEEEARKEEARKEAEEKKEDVSRAVGEEVHEQYPGAVSPTGEINWDCPCLGGLGSEGPCVEEFRSAFSCWMFSTADQDGGEKGDDCVDNFFAMSACMQQNEEFYDDLNARNKAAAAEALAKYEEEEKAALAAAEQEQAALETSEIQDEVESSIISDQTLTSSEAYTVEETRHSHVTSLPEQEFPKAAEFGVSTSVIVAATLDEQGTEREEEEEKVKISEEELEEVTDSKEEDGSL